MGSKIGKCSGNELKKIYLTQRHRAHREVKKTVISHDTKWTLKMKAGLFHSFSDSTDPNALAL